MNYFEKELILNVTDRYYLMMPWSYLIMIIGLISILIKTCKQAKGETKE